MIDPALAWHVVGALGFASAFIVIVAIRKLLNAIELKLPLPSILARLVIFGSVVFGVFAAARVLGADKTGESALALLIGASVGIWSAIAFEPKVIGKHRGNT